MNGVVPLTVALPLGGAAIMLLLNTVLGRRRVHALALAVVVGDIVLTASLLDRAGSGTLVYWFGGWTPRHGVALGISFTVDQFGGGAAVLSCVVVAAAVLTCRWAIDEADGIVHALLLTLLAAMVGFCLTGDLFNMFVFFELMTVSAFGLAAYRAHSRRALRSALNFAISNSIGAFLVLIGIALIYSRTGALNLAQIGRQLTASGRVDRLTIIAWSLLVVGFLTKAAVVPFHFWLIDTVSFGPVPLAVILGGALDMLGVYAVARIYWTAFSVPLSGHHQVVQAVLIGTGLVSAVAGGGMAVMFREPRRRVAFIMVSHTGILLVGVGCLSARGLAGSAVYAVGDGTVKATLFIGVALLTSRPRAGRVILGLGGLALAGLPVFGTGLGQAAIGEAASAAGYRWVTPVVLIAAALGAAAALELAWAAHSERDDAPPRPWRTPFGIAVALLGGSAGAGFLGRWAAAGGARFVDAVAYQGQVLDRRPSLAPRTAGIGFSAGRLAFELVAVATAVVLTAGLVRGRGHRHVWGVVGPGLRRWHNGSIGDSAMWITIGTASVAFAFAVGLR